MKKNLVISLLLLVAFIDATGQTYGNEWIDFSKTYYKFPVREQRFFRIPYNTLTNYGLNNIPAEHFQLWRDGIEVPLYTSASSGILPSNGYLEFFAKPSDGFDQKELFTDPNAQAFPERSFFLDTAWYFLTVNAPGPNKRFIQENNGVNTTTLAADSFYMSTSLPMAGSTSFSGGFARSIGGNNIYSSNWDAGEGYSSGPITPTRTIEYNITNLRAFLNGSPFSIQYKAAGGRALDHDLRLKVNDILTDSLFFRNFEMKTGTKSNLDPTGYLNADAINLKFSTQNTDPYEYFQLVDVRIKYARKFFNNSQLPIEIQLPANPAGNHIRLQGLPNGSFTPALYDLTNLKRYTGEIKPDSSLFLIAPSNKERTIVIGTQNPAHIRSVTSFKEIHFRNFLLPENQGDYLIISHFLLRQGDDPVLAYNDYRKSFAGGGYNSRIYDIDELAEQFAYGTRKNPLSIRRFVLFAIDKFPVKPKMVFLIGRGNNYFSYYRATSGGTRENMNMVPTWGTPSSDNLLASRNNVNPVPEIPIGRLGAVNPDEVQDYLDKVKSFEALQRKRPTLPSDNEWRKKVIHLIGGDDEYLADSILSRFMTTYSNDITPPKPGFLVNQYVRINNPDFSKDIRQIEKDISGGVGLISYFGHSSSSSIDFNLGSPDQYSNADGRFPIIIANGCKAGGIFEFTTQRLYARETSISDNFIFAPNNGAISFISNSDLGVINYLNLLTREWYKAFSNAQFGKTIGEIQREALLNAFNRTGSADFLNRCNIEQNILHSDPAIVPFWGPKPDFSVEAAYTATNPSRIYTELDSLGIQVDIFNLGLAVTDSVLVRIERELPNGLSKLLYNQYHKNLFNRDSLHFKIALKGLFEEGNGYLLVKIDPANQFLETDEDNNVAILPFKTERNHIQPVFPYNYSIVNYPGVALNASTTNGIDAVALYQFQIDTTLLFNSPSLVVKDTLSQSGVVEWMPNMSFQTGQVYFWRVLKAGFVSNLNTPVYSFRYQPGSQTGYNQSDYWQHLSSLREGLVLDTGNLWNYGNREHNLYVSHGIYPNSGTEDTHFSITVEGEMTIRSACLGRSIIFNLFDPHSFKQIKNAPTGAYGSADSCAPGREYNFEFRYYSYQNRKLIMDFLDSIPAGTYVAARLVADKPYDSLLANYWLADTAIFGNGKSLYHSLKNNGFYDIDSLNSTKTFFFMYKKGDSLSFKPYSKLSRGLNDRVYASVYPTTTDSYGTVSSPWVGPAQNWSGAAWELEKKGLINPESSLQLWAKNTNQQEFMLKQWTDFQGINMDISDINANQYPYLQYRLFTSGPLGSDPVQLKNWQVFYTALPDGAWSPADHLSLNKDTLNPTGDTLSLSIAFKNISRQWLDTIPVRAYAVNQAGNETNLFIKTFKALNPGDTSVLSFYYPVNLPEGDYDVQIEANEAGIPLEEHFFNNRVKLPIHILGGTLAISDFTFNAIKSGNEVKTNWVYKGSEKVQSYTVEHALYTNEFKTLTHISADISANSGNQFEYYHKNPEPGLNYYRLKLEYADGRFSYSEIKPVFFEKRNNFKIAPNPFRNYFTLQPLDHDSGWHLRISDINGQVILLEKGRGMQKIDLQRAPSGVYFVQIFSEDGIGEIIKIVKQ